MTPDTSHEHFMRLAIRQAHEAAEEGEVPAGCVIVHAPAGAAARIVGRAHNQTERLRDPTAHAEMIAITQAAAAVGDWRLTDTTLYVTKEPCAMCAGAIVLARIPRVVVGVTDPLRGGVSVFGILNHGGLNHRAETVTGVLEEECRALLRDFFGERRGGRAAKPDITARRRAPPPRRSSGPVPPAPRGSGSGSPGKPPG